MTRNEALSLFENSVRKMAEALGITEQAIHQWGETVPELRVYQIREVVRDREIVRDGDSAK